MGKVQRQPEVEPIHSQLAPYGKKLHVRPRRIEAEKYLSNYAGGEKWRWSKDVCNPLQADQSHLDELKCLKLGYRVIRSQGTRLSEHQHFSHFLIYSGMVKNKLTQRFCEFFLRIAIKGTYESVYIGVDLFYECEKGHK